MTSTARRGERMIKRKQGEAAKVRHLLTVFSTMNEATRRDAMERIKRRYK